MPDHKGKKVAILGAGSAGLSAAWALSEAGWDVVVLEEKPWVGGLCASIQYGQNKYDCGTHHFHTDDQKLFYKINTLMNNSLIGNERLLYIRFKGKFFRYPLKILDILMGLEPKLIFESLISFFASWFKTLLFRPSPKNAEEVLISKYGKKLYEVFFKDYTTKFWGVPPSQLSARFAIQRISRLDVLSFLKKVMEMVQRKQTATPDQFIELVVGKLFYLPSGIGSICERMAEMVTQFRGKILLNSRVTGIQLLDSGVVSEVYYDHDGQQKKVSCDFVISTIPLRSLVERIVGTVASDVQNSARKLRMRSLCVICLLIHKPHIQDGLFVYYRDKIFNRLAEPKNSGLKVYPDDHTILLAEISCDKGDSIWNGGEKLIKKVINELIEEKLFNSEAIKDTFLIRLEHAYPFMEVGFEEHLERINTFLSQTSNLFCIGRQGSFNYVNMHVAMKMGFQTAGRLICNNCKPSESSKLSEG
jgi:protoporphyrinogen oxidase